MPTPGSPPPLVHDHLENALAADTPTKKNYHIRAALQAFAIVEHEAVEEREREAVRNRS